MEGLHEDTGDISMHCTEHPFKNNTPSGAICAICLQEKLGKLVSSSFPITVFPSSSSSSSPSFRSDICVTTSSKTTTTIIEPVSNTQITRTNSTKCHHQYHSNRSKILYLMGQKKKKKKDLNIIIDDQNKNLVFKRSKSTADGLIYNEHVGNHMNRSHNKRGFWSFTHLKKHTHSTSSSNKTLTDISSNTMSASTRSQRQENQTIMEEENDNTCHVAIDRKVSRSRSVGCGSRSFSGDFFERISTGFGDCTLRRVESNREGKSKVTGTGIGIRTGVGQDSIKERVRCGGLFSGFVITSSSSSSSSSSYWVGSHVKESGNGNVNGKVTSAVGGKERSWVTALASPMRAFSKTTSSSKRGGSNKNSNPNLAAIPSLLSVRS